MGNIEEYILRPLQERRSHLKLTEPCIFRGGDTSTVSFYMKGMLAHTLDTTIPFGHKIHACHACHNSLCSNVFHLYWGTPRENRYDAIANGAPASVWDCMVTKYGEAKAREIQKNNGNLFKKKRLVSQPLSVVVEDQTQGSLE